jgi:ribonuclease P protein component
MKKRKNFQILGKRTYLEGLSFAKINNLFEAGPKIYVTLPRATGNAVQRNRFKRLVRTALPSFDPTLLEKNSLWISLDRKFRLSRKITREDWMPLFERISAARRS